jgi:hypothetical protein
MKAKLIKTEDEEGVMYSLSGDNLPENYVLSKQNCEEEFAKAMGVIDVDSQVGDIVKTICPDDRGYDIIYGTGMAVGIQCFLKAMELNKDKVFTVEDMIEAMTLNRKNLWSQEEVIAHFTKQPTEIEVEIVMEKVVDETKMIGVVKGVKGSGDKITTYKSVPKLDSEGCLILKRK